MVKLNSNSLKVYIMKYKLKYLALFTLVFMLSCTNQENEFDDFDVQNVYFPLQFPVRTVNLIEDSRIDNSIDLERAFSIGVSIGGLRNNTKDRVINIAPAPELADNALIDGRTALVMPSNYYSIESSSSITIPAGSFSGKIKVDLTDAFFADPLALEANYVIPLKIIDGNYSVLDGTPSASVADPDVRVTSDWEAGKAPKNFTMFAVKYINKYDGVYLYKGEDNTLDGPNGNVVGTPTIYNEAFLEKNDDTELTTLTLSKSLTNRMGQNVGNNFQMELTIADDGSITISPVTGANSVTGTGRFVTKDDADAESWGGQSHKTMFLEYEYENGGVFHRVKDTLVYRNDNTVFEEFDLTIN